MLVKDKCSYNRISACSGSISYCMGEVSQCSNGVATYGLLSQKQNVNSSGETPQIIRASPE